MIKNKTLLFLTLVLLSACNSHQLVSGKLLFKNNSSQQLQAILSLSEQYSDQRCNPYKLDISVVSEPGGMSEKSGEIECFDLGISYKVLATRKTNASTTEVQIVNWTHIRSTTDKLVEQTVTCDDSGCIVEK